MHQEKEVTTNELLEFLQENMLTKEDAKQFATKDDLKNLEDRLAIRFSVIEQEIADIKTKLTDIENRLKEDTDALVLEVEKLKERVAVLELQLKTQHAN
ncbi:MAG: hypothetical protein Q8P82_00255 [bacterium]|nr:hypothetical protein [bacterium]